jgi:hypothetical protein
MNDAKKHRAVEIQENRQPMCNETMKRLACLFAWQLRVLAFPNFSGIAMLFNQFESLNPLSSVQIGLTKVFGKSGCVAIFRVLG